MRLEKDKVDTIAIGGFDGIHRGHMQLIKRLGKNGALVVVKKENSSLTPGVKRCEYSKYPCKFYHFLKIKGLSGEEFVELLKKDFPILKKIVVGYDFLFGKHRSCKAEDLRDLFDGEVEIVSEYKYDGTSVHSRYIKQMIEDGELHRANRLLGREYSLVGEVIKGQGVGAKKLYPTLNLKVQDFVLPKNGVYATRTLINDKIYDSVSFVGIRLSVDGNFSLETHVIGKDIEENVKYVELFFVKRLRNNKKFETLENLKKQISKDIKKASLMLHSCLIHLDDATEGY